MQRKRADALVLALQLVLVCNVASRPDSQCPPPDALLGCSCYNFADGLFLECAGPSEDSLRTALARVVAHAKSHETLVQSVRVHELDDGLEELRASVFPAGLLVRQLQVSHSSLREVSETAFRSLRSSLESLALVSGRLVQVPQRALAELDGLAALDLEANLVQELASYCFYGLKLVKLSLKANRIAKVSEYAFAGLEPYLAELDLAENRLKHFPMPALRKLENLDSLRLAWNFISTLPGDGYSRLEGLTSIDLGGNEFSTLSLNCFRCCPRLRSLSLHYNGLENVDRDAFIGLAELESLDLSHNKIIFLDGKTFRANQRLRNVELSHNHLHHVGAVFAGLPELRELQLAENNVLEVPTEAFAGSTKLLILHLQQNAIRRIDARGLAGLRELEQLHLTLNYIERLPPELFEHCCANLTTLALDNNRIRDLEPGTFARLGRLRELRLQDNRLAEVSRGVFAPLPGLQELHLQDNAITDVQTGALRSLRGLEHINLQGNQLAVLGDVFRQEQDNHQQQLGSLLSLQLDGNGLGVLHNDSLRGQASLKVMWLGHNKLTRLQAPLFRDLLQVERLYLTNNSISRIEDAAFRPMQALKFLELSQNRLTEIGVATFAELRELEELHLRDNGLRRIAAYALTALKRLRVLDLGDNLLGVLHDTMFQEGLPIRSLSLRNCSLGTIERGAFRGLNNLYELGLEFNQLPAFQLERLDIPGLRILRVSHNNLSLVTAQTLAGLPSLLQLEAESAQLSRLPETFLHRCKSLSRLLLGSNLLRDLPAQLLLGLEALRELKLEANRFQETPYEALAGAKNLEVLSLARNAIRHLDASRIRGLRQLRELDLGHNLVESMSGFALANLSRLFSVDLSHNELHSLPANFFTNSPQLRRVDLSGNKFHQLPAAALSGRNLPGLAWLNMTANPITRVYGDKPVSLPVLQEIHLEQVNLSILTSQEFEAFPGLQNLYLGRNGISRVSPGAFRSLPNLLTLHLGGNGLDILPQERLRGLEHLRILNLTRNRLKELEEFPEDLKALQMLDLSFNQIGAVGKLTFKNLVNLVELHLYGNWISAVSGEAFRPLKKLRLLDLSRNYLENLPLNAFRPLETQIRSLRAEENPLNCGCESQELWQWLRDHQKLIGPGPRRGQIQGNTEASALRCEQPPELRGLVFLDLEPSAFCTAPLIAKLVVQDVQPFSVLVSWQSRNHSGLHGYQVAFYALDAPQEVHSHVLEPSSRSVRLGRLQPNTRYRLCVLGLDGREGKQHRDAESRCTDVITLALPDAVASSDGSSLQGGDRSQLQESTSANSVLTRRLGLIVGCCMGFVVFLLLVSVLGYLKVKKQREAAKRDQQAMPTEYISYRHFSIQSGEAGHKQHHLQQQLQAAPSLDSQTQQHQPPSFIKSSCPGATPSL
ncbi:protein artichoke-like [Copidosoma floridanum]|uniref:protein artichoke-like n=1 Tax=Copidosoma floridanum TaxID=29053 RepID=UPI000C6FB4FD|nr:protein artichoke-like [Copidosoma floridanum]